VSPKVSGDHAHTCACARVYVCVCVCEGPCRRALGPETCVHIQGHIQQSHPGLGKAEGVAATWSLGLASWGRWGVLPPTLVRQGEQKCSVDMSIFLSHGEVSSWLPKEQAPSGAPAVCPPRRTGSCPGTPGMPGAPRELILHVSIAVVLFFIWDGVGGGGPQGPPSSADSHVMCSAGHADSGEGLFKEAAAGGLTRPSALGTSSKDSKLNFLFVVGFLLFFLLLLLFFSF